MHFENNLILCRLILRRDRLSILFWFAGIMLLVVGFGGTMPGMYPTEAERAVMAETMKSPAMIAMLGPVYDSVGYTVGAMYTNYMVLWTAMAVAIMNIFLVVRHTRQDEECGRIEVVRSLPVGRLSNLSAVLTVSLIQNLVLALLIGLGITALGVDSMDFSGAMLFGAVIGASGLVFAAATAVFCQLCSSPRTAQSLSFAFLITAYIVRAMGDMQSELLACISPLGLVLRTQAFVENLWWPIFVVLLESVAAIAIAFRLCAIRDMGEGLIPARPGAKDASPLLSSAMGLAWRLLGMPFFIWVFIIALIGMAYGSIMGDMESFISTNELFRTMFPDADPSEFISFLMVIMAVIGTIPILQFILKARSQESGGYAENILARAVSRSSQLSGYFIIALAAGIVMPFVTAAGFWAGSFPVMDNPIAFTTFLKASIVYIPAIYFMLGIAMLLIGFIPRYSAFIWVYLGYGFFTLYVGGVIDLPDFIIKLTPYSHIPRVPLEDFNLAKITIMVVISIAMFVAGYIGHRNRDMRFS